MIKNKFLLALVILTSNSLFLESSNLVIKNAEIYDGIEKNSYQGHILINDGVIAKI
jgi:adenine deaminase